MKKQYSRAYRKNFAPEPSAKATAQKALKVAKSANAHELKYLDTDQSSLTGIVGPAGTYLWTSCTELLQGTANNRRVGNTVIGTSFDLRCQIEYNPLSAFSNQLVRIIIFQNLNSGVSSATTDYLQSVNFNSHKSIDNRFNTVTLHDQVYEVSADHNMRLIEIRKKLKKKLLTYGNAAAAPEKHNISVLAISSEPVSLQGPILFGQMRLFFHDK